MNPAPSDPDLEALIRWAPGPVLVLDPGLRIATVNEALLRSTNTTREAVLGRDLFDAFPGNVDDPADDGPAQLRASLERVLATRSPDRMPITRYDVPRPAAEGGGFEERYWNALSYPVLDGRGEVTHIIHQSEDVTELVRLRRLEAEHAASLAEANGLFQAVYDQGFFAGRIGLDGRLIDANRSSLEQCGFTRDEVIGKLFWECGWWSRSPEVQAWVKDGFERAARGEPFRGVSAYFRADGTERIVEYACMPIKDESGRVLFVTPTGMDITERFRAERDRRATEILESITDAFFALGPDWRFTYVNRQAERVLGRSPGDLVGQVIWDEYPGLIGSEFERAYRRAATEGVASSVTSYYPDHDRWYEVHSYPAPHGISVYFRDVSDRRRAEAERERLIAESERQRLIYEVALSNTPDLVYVFGLDHRFVYANEALLRMWGKTRDEALGKNCLELGYEPWHAAMHDREIEQVVATRRPIRGEVPFTGTNGRRIYDYIFSPVIGADGEVVAVAGTTRDVTERQQAEQEIREQSERLRENDHRKDEFLAMLAHELRNPLSAISNAVRVARRSASEEDRAWAEGVIERQADKLSRLVDDLLDVSRITRGKIRLDRQVIDARPVLQGAVEAVRPLVDEREHELTVSTGPGALAIEADAMRLEQILINLLTNAAKYTEPGGHIRVSAAREGSEVVFGVQDDGMGIPPEALPTMFELFAQGERSIARSEGGLGIGLTLVRKLAEMHGGGASARSDGPGRGSTFIVRLPATEAAPTPAPAPGPAPVAGRAGARVLIIDDNADAARGLARLLKILGHEVTTADDGPSGIEAARRDRPDVVLLDIGLPGMDGYRVASQLREDGCRDALLIAVTGYGQDEDRRRALEAGFDHHFVKPVDHDALVALLAR